MKKDTRNNSKDTRNNSPDSKLDPDHSWGGLNFVKEIVKFFEAKVDTKNLPSDETKNQASAALVGAGTQPTDKTTKPSVLVTRTAPDSPLVDIKTIKEDDPSMPAAPSPRSTSSDDSARGSTRSRSPDSAAGVFGGQQNPYLGSRPSSPANQVSIHPQPLISSAPCRTHNEIPKTPTFIDGLPDVFSALGALFQVNPDTSPDTSTKPPRVKNSGRTGSTAPSSSRRSNSSTSEITAADPSVVSTQNEKVNNKTGCLPKPKFLAKLLSKFSLSKSKNTDKESVVSTSAGSATPSRPASTIAESERGSATAGSTRRSEIRSASPARSTTARDGSPRKPATKSWKERLNELWQYGKFHESDNIHGGEKKIYGKTAITLDGARKLKNTPKKAAAFFRNLGSGLSERISGAYNKISSIKLPQLPERNEVRQQPASFTRQSSPSRKSFSQIFSENTDWLRKLSSNINQQPHQPNSYSPPSNNGKSSLFSRASELFQGIKKDYADYKKGKEYTSYRSSYRGTGRIPNPTMPSQADIKKVASTLANNASWVCRIAGDGARDAAGYACSSAARRAEAAKSYAKRASNWVDNYSTNSVHARWWPGR